MKFKSPVPKPFCWAAWETTTQILTSMDFSSNPQGKENTFNNSPETQTYFLRSAVCKALCKEESFRDPNFKKCTPWKKKTSRLVDQEALCKENTGVSTVLDQCIIALRTRQKNLAWMLCNEVDVHILDFIKLKSTCFNFLFLHFTISEIKCVLPLLQPGPSRYSCHCLETRAGPRFFVFFFFKAIKKIYSKSPQIIIISLDEFPPSEYPM